jgi:hypothetical protein
MTEKIPEMTEKIPEMAENYPRNDRKKIPTIHDRTISQKSFAAIKSYFSHTSENFLSVVGLGRLARRVIILQLK